MLPPVTPPTLAISTAAAATDTSSSSTPGTALAALGNLAWNLPFTAAGSAANVRTCPATAVVSATMNGAVGVTYNVTLRFLGIVETKAYTGGSSDLTSWQVGGTPSGTVWNIYKLEISSPSQTYYLNRGADSAFTVLTLDITKTIQITTGATVTMTADAVGTEEVYHTTSHPALVFLDATRPVQPYYGQFINMEVLSVTT